MDERTEREHPEILTRRQFLSAAAAAPAPLAGSGRAVAQAPAHPPGSTAKPGPAEVFIDHGINQGTRLETLRGYLTPPSHFFIRNHTTTPVIDLRSWRLRVEGSAVEKPLELTFEDLLRLPSRAVICFVECAGNGRGFFKEFMGRVASGTQWRLGALGVAQGRGVPLAAVLDLARGKRDTPRDVLNVLIEGPDSVKGNPPISPRKAPEDGAPPADALNGPPLL